MMKLTWKKRKPETSKENRPTETNSFVIPIPGGMTCQQFSRDRRRSEVMIFPPKGTEDLWCVIMAVGSCDRRLWSEPELSGRILESVVG
ncbi:hypothetical protein SLA2020_207090 [Shorea laevis]